MELGKQIPKGYVPCRAIMDNWLLGVVRNSFTFSVRKNIRKLTHRYLLETLPIEPRLL
jgi:hypothetical protein